jgi:hypothetical protein
MKRISSLCALAFLLTLFTGCSGSSSSSPVPSTKGSFTVSGSSTVSGALTAPNLYSKATISGTPTSVKIKAYRVYLAANADCSNPILVDNKDTTADYVDLMAATKPILFSADSVAPGTYQCMILKLSDIFKFTPDATAESVSGGVCVAGNERGFDIHKTEVPTELWYDLQTGGTNTGEGTIATSVEQTVFLFASTDPSAVSANNALIASTQLGTLLNPVVITAGETTKAAFVVDTTDRMSVIPYDNGSGTQDYCWLEGFDAQFLAQ